MNFCSWILVLLFTVVLVHCNADTNACSNIIAEDGSEYDLITLVEKGYKSQFLSKPNPDLSINNIFCCRHVSVRLQVGVRKL